MANSLGVCNTNYLDTSANTYSSQNPVYPASNVFNLQQRKQVWRTFGYWLIESGSETIVFRETIGVDLTATIAAAAYTSTTAFLAAIKAALEAAGDSTYTVEMVAGKIRITSNGSGGGGIFQLRMEAAGSADMAAIMGFDTVALTGALNYTADEVRIHTSEWLVFDMGIPTNPKAFCLVNDRNNPMRISPTATIRLMANPTNNWAAPAVDLTIPYADMALAVWDFEGLADVDAGYRYWKFEIIDRDNPRGYLEFGACFLGDMITMTRGCAVRPLQFQGRDTSVIVVSEGGQVFGRKTPKTMGWGVRFQGLLRAEQEDLEAHWENVGITENFFAVLDARNAFSTVKENRVKLVRFNSDYQAELVSYDNFSAEMNLVEAL